MNACARPAAKLVLAPILSSPFVRQHDALIAFDQDIMLISKRNKKPPHCCGFCMAANREKSCNGKGRDC